MPTYYDLRLIVTGENQRGHDMADVRITVRKNGPYRIEGAVELVDAEGKPIPIPEGKPAIALCRCGGSTTKPFCDGTHSRIGFIGAEEAVRRSGEED